MPIDNLRDGEAPREGTVPAWEGEAPAEPRIGVSGLQSRNDLDSSFPRRRRAAGRLAVVTRNVAPLKKEPDRDSEQVSQALIGQPLVAEGGSKDWLFVQTWDTYRGWIHRRDLRILADGEQTYASSGPVAVIRELIADICSETGEIITKATITAQLEVADSPSRREGVVSPPSHWEGVVSPPSRGEGAVSPPSQWEGVRGRASAEEAVPIRLPDGRAGSIRKHEAKLVDKSAAQTIWLPEPRKLIETATRFVGTPYLWGGTSPFGLDCSGFIQLVHKIHGVTLLRDAHLQASDPRAIEVDRADLRPGDLVFFRKKREKKVSHVGMVIGGGRFIHSRGSSGVTITPLDSPDYSAIYVYARRMRLATLDPGGGAPEE